MRRQRSLVKHIAGQFGSFMWQRRGWRYFRIQLSSRHRDYVAPVRQGLIVTALGLGLWGLWCAVQTSMTFYEAVEIRARLEQVSVQDRQLLAETRQEGIDLSESSLQLLPGQVAQANQLLVRRNFSWTQFLSGLERALPPNVSVKGVRLDQASAMVYITGVATTVDDVSALTMHLQTHPVFYDPVLGQHHVGSDGFVEFDVKLKYRVQGA